ncbi:hypothetical protein CRG98_046448 [Punica granatum]|uniref:Uncharacterized protein n=1 Tax=Punica granatum TaxID=22663 RepID=A0A2I0HNW7_PUNGR|nr:hypothetical protein CRG98_046448 [Punica granatum]
MRANHRHPIAPSGGRQHPLRASTTLPRVVIGGGFKSEKGERTKRSERLFSVRLGLKSLTDRLYLKQRLYKLRLSLGTSVGDPVDLFNQIAMDLANVDVKMEDEDQALLLLYSLSKSHESFDDTILYGRTSTTLEDVNALLNSKELRWKRTCWICDEEGHLKRDYQRQKSQGIDEYMDDEAKENEAFPRLQRIGRQEFERLTPKEKYLGDLGLDKMDGCRSGSRGQVEKPMKKVEFMVEDPETLETQPMMVEDVQMGRSKRRQHSLWNSSRTGDMQMEHFKPRDCFELTGLVVSGNAEVGDTTCR